MAKIFITGSGDGLGRMAAQLLVAGGHEVVLHGRNDKRIQEALAAVPGAAGAVSGDLSSIRETMEIAKKVNALGAFERSGDAGMAGKQRGVVGVSKRKLFFSSAGGGCTSCCA